MFAAELSYRSWVAASGYVWVRYSELGKDPSEVGVKAHEKYKKGWVLTEDPAAHKNPDENAPRRYGAHEAFSEHPTLYREFAAIPWGDRPAALAFATRYGLLESHPEMHYRAKPLPADVWIPSRYPNVPCDPESTWFEYPARFRGMIHIWELLKKKDTDKAKTTLEMGKLIKWEKLGTAHQWVWHPDRARDDSPDLKEVPVYRSWHTPERGAEEGGQISNSVVPPFDGMSDILDVAGALLRQEISKGLDEGYPFSVRLVQGSEGRDHFRVRPRNLLGALYLQFGRAVAGDKDHRPCRTCGTWFELVPQDKGRKEFCGDSCKVKEYRERKKMAAELSGAGRTPEAIAEATNTDLKTVKKWIGKKAPTKRKGK